MLHHNDLHVATIEKNKEVCKSARQNFSSMTLLDTDEYNSSCAPHHVECVECGVITGGC